MTPNKPPEADTGKVEKVLADLAEKYRKPDPANIALEGLNALNTR